MDWKGTTDTDWEKGTNWDTGVKPTAADNVYFVASGNVDCSLTAASVCKSLSANSSYTKTFSTNGQSLTVSGNCQFSHTGPLSLNSSSLITLNADGSFGIATSVTTFTGGAGIDLKGTGNLDIDENISASPLRNVTCAYSGKTTTVTGDIGVVNSMFNGQLTINGGTFNTASGKYITISCDNANPIVIVGTPTIGNAGRIYLTQGSQATVSIPAMTMTGIGSLIIEKTLDPDVTWNLAGNLSMEGPFYVINLRAAGMMTFNTGTNPYYNITCATIFIGGFQTGSSSTFNFNSSTITCGPFSGSTYAYKGSEYNVGSLIAINLGSSVWNCSGHFVWNSIATIDAGTAQATFSTNTSTITSSVASGTPWYTLIINGAGKTYTMTSDLACNTITVTAGIFNSQNYELKATAGMSFGGTGNLTLGGNTTMTSNGTFSITTSGTVTTTACVLAWQGNTTVTVGTRTFSRIILSAGKTYTWSTTNNITVTNYTAGDWSGAAGNVITWVSSSPGTGYKIIPPQNTYVNYVNATDSTAGGNYIIHASSNTNTNSGRNSNWRFKPKRVLYSITGGSTISTENYQNGVYPTVDYSSSSSVSIFTASASSTNPLDIYYSSGGLEARTMIKWGGISLSGKRVVRVDFTITKIQIQSAVNIYECKRDFVDSQATWTEYSTGNSWQTAGGKGANDIGSTILGSLYSNQFNQLPPISVELNSDGLALVQSWVDGAANYGFFICDAGTNANQKWYGVASLTEPYSSYRPKFTIYYQ
jgi:hypothetical protein